MTGPSLSHILDHPQPPLPVADRPLPASTPAHAHRTFSTPVSLGPSPSPSSGHSLPPMGQDSMTGYNPNLSSSAPTHDNPQPESDTASDVNHKDKNLYGCRDCGRSYSRPEHLVRHVQTHTLGRRFVCEICEKSFARKDLLRRHVANHKNDSPNRRRRKATSPSAGRVSQACRPCATARVKCDDSKPCRRCISRKLTCVSSETGSAAAMHLSHLSANAHTTNSSPSSIQLVASPSLADSVSSSSPKSSGWPRSTPATHDTSSKSTPLPPATARPEDNQLPTPDTVTEQVESWSKHPASRSMSVSRAGEVPANSVMDNPEGLPPPYQQPPTGVIDATRMPYFDFLRDVLYEQPCDTTKLADSQGLPVLDFCSDSNLELTDLDFGLLNNWNVDGMAGSTQLPQEIPHTSGQTAAKISQMRQSLVNVWTDSPWRWNPGHQDNGYKEQVNLPVPETDTSSAEFRESHKLLERVTEETLLQSTRDKVLGIVLSTCRSNTAKDQVAASFPSTDAMNNLIHIFLAAQACQVSEWIHFPTFKLNEQWPEWIALAVAAGAVLTPLPTLRKFGFAVLEACRLAVPVRVEDDNTTIQNPGIVQSLVMTHDLGLWSGNRRRMEIAECHIAIPVTMMRYRSKFLRSQYPMVAILASDEGEVLEQKWKSWIEREQWKRLVFHCYLREAQNSMTTLTNGCMSYSELSLPLPEARELWFAKTASEWKTQYLQRNSGQAKRAPSLGDLFHDVHLLPSNYLRLDVQYSISIFLHGFWALILEYRQLSAVHRSRSYANSLGGNPNLLLSSRHQELVKDLQSFQLISSEWQDVSAQEHVLLNLLMMNLHVSLDDLQLFSGKEGEEQARRIYPVLQQWAVSAEARSAMWCAGQILRYARNFPQGHLKDFYAVAVHHASLALWTYGVIVRASRRQQTRGQYGFEPVYLDGSDSISMQRFIGFEQGQPTISGAAPRTGQGPAAEASLHDPRACMEIMEEVLRCNSEQSPGGMPPIVENLCQLIRQLGTAAWAVGLG